MEAKIKISVLEGMIIHSEPLTLPDGDYMLTAAANDAPGKQGLWLCATPPPEGILHKAYATQMHKDAEDALRAIDEQNAKRERRLAQERRRDGERRGTGLVDSDGGLTD